MAKIGSLRVSVEVLFAARTRLSLSLGIVTQVLICKFERMCERRLPDFRSTLAVEFCLSRPNISCHFHTAGFTAMPYF